jgi:hypothetical protein
MTPGKLLQSVERFLDAPEPAAVPVLTQAIVDLADMVGWAPGPIDPNGRFADRLLALLTRLRERHAAEADAGVAAIHDALGTLGDAIVRHDRDFSADDPDDTVQE